MKQQTQNTGIGYYQKQKAFYAQRVILTILSDGQWHQYKVLKQKAKLSSRTLVKHLDQMKNVNLIEKKTDNESGKYPVPVLYRAQPETVEYIQESLFIENIRQKIEPALMESKDPLMLLELIHSASQLAFIKIINELKNRKNMSDFELDYLEELFMHMPYTFFTRSLVGASKKIVDELDFDKLVIAQVKRQKETAEYVLKKLAEKGIIKEKE